jgi:pimeloyl-ACP methyl ester carboxylesterase
MVNVVKRLLFIGNFVFCIFTGMKRFLSISLAVFAILISCISCLTFRDSNAEIYSEFEKENLKADISTLKIEDNEIRYVFSKTIDKRKPTIIFVHGAPGSSSDFFTYLKDSALNTHANLVSVDRLGYGYSEFGQPFTKLETQAHAILQIIEKHDLERVVVVGWSFGVPIAAKMATINNKLDRLVLIAGAISPELEKYFILGKLAEWKLTKWMVPIPLRIAQYEKLDHVAELKILENEWKQIVTPTDYFHGKKDNIVPFDNLYFIKSKMPDSLLTTFPVEKSGHLLPIKKIDLLRNHLLEILNTI